MFRYKLRTLLVLLAAVPPLLWFGWTKYEPWRAEQERQKAAAEISAEIDRLLLLEAKMLTGPPAPPPVVTNTLRGKFVGDDVGNNVRKMPEAEAGK